MSVFANFLPDNFSLVKLEVYSFMLAFCLARQNPLFVSGSSY